MYRYMYMSIIIDTERSVRQKMALKRLHIALSYIYKLTHYTTAISLVDFSVQLERAEAHSQARCRADGREMRQQH